MKMHKQQKGEYAYPPYERKRVFIMKFPHWKVLCQFCTACI